MVESPHSTKPVHTPCAVSEGIANNGYKTMQAGWVLLYFLLGCAALAVMVFPGAIGGLRQRALKPFHGAWWRLRRAGQVGWHQAGRQPRQVAQVCRDGLAQAKVGWRARWPWLLLTLALLGLPATVVLWWSAQSTRSLDGFDDRIDPGNSHVAHLLQGEQLVPPPPLPPEWFSTAEVEVERPMIASADRRWDQMDAEFVQRLLLAFRIMKQEHGYDMALLEGWRSPDRQRLLAARGANVTMAGAWQSYHQYGLAADCAFLRNGKLLITEKDPWAMRGYQLYGEVAERLGLTWGGRWQMMDLGHVEWRKPGIKEAMRARRGS